MSNVHPQFTLRCGDSWLFEGPLNDNNGNPLNLAGATLTWRLDSLDFTKNLITQTLGTGITVTNLAAAIVAYGPTKEQTASIPPGTYYDILRVDFSDGITGDTVVEGIINAAPGPGGAVVVPPPLVTPWWSAYTISGIDPAIVLSFVSNQYYDGISDAALSSLVQNAIVTPGIGLLCNATNINCIGTLLTALKAPAVTVAAKTNGATSSFGGILGFNTGDTPLLYDNSPANALTSFKNSGSIRVSSNNTATWTGNNSSASGWNSSGRAVMLDQGALATDSNAFGAFTNAALGSFSGAGEFGGYIELLLIYPGLLIPADFTALTYGGPWTLPLTLSRDLLFSGSNYVTPGSVLAYEHTQPWTMMCAVQSPPMGSIGVIFTNVVNEPYSGYEVYVNASGKVVVRIMSSWNGSSTGAGSGLIEVDSSITLSANTSWYTIGATYDGSGSASGVKIYINDTQDASATVISDGLTGSIVSGDQQLFVGNQFGGGFPIGILGPFILWDVVKSPAYFTAAVASNQIPSVDSNTQLYYTFQEGSGTTTADLSTNNFFGTLSSSSMWTV